LASIHHKHSVLFFAVLNAMVGHIMDVLSPFISVLCHSDWFFHGKSCPCIDVVHPGRAWSSSPACTWHCSSYYLFLQATPLFPHGVTIVCRLALTVSNSFIFTPSLLKTHSLVFFAVYEIRGIFLSPFISKSVKTCFFMLSECPAFTAVQLYVATGHTSAFISRDFDEIGMLWLFHIFYSDAPIACPLFNLVGLRNSVVHSTSSVIRDSRYGNVSTCSSCSFWMVCGTLFRRSPLLWSCGRWCI